MASRLYSQLASLYLTYAVIPATLTYTQLATSPTLTGTVSGSSSTSAILTGSPSIVASALTSTSTATHSLTGLAALFGTSGGNSSILGTVIGREEDLGVIGGTSATDGTANGSPAFAGQITGTATSNGTVVSTEPPVVGTGVGRPPRPMHTPLPNLHLPRFGWAYGISFEDGIVNGARGQTGTALGAQTTTHTISGLASFTAPMIQSSVTLNANPISGDITVREHAEQELLAALGYL